MSRFFHIKHTARSAIFVGAALVRHHPDGRVLNVEDSGAEDGDADSTGSFESGHVADDGTVFHTPQWRNL